ncbi:hypothetical protein EJ08DRAFT_586846, partial [Tothia fuscella]
IMESSNRKPAILCLHGGGTSATIYKIQTLRLRRALSSHFDFVFLNAPFITAAGPGVLPFFEDAGPFYSWEKPGDGGKTPKESIMIVEEAMKRRYAETRQPFTAVMGFSQGAKLGATVMLGHQRKQKQGRTLLEGPKFGIFLMGICPRKEDSERLCLPTIHVVGSNDVYREESKRLSAECCQQQTTTHVELPIGHHIPNAQAHIRELVVEIVRVYCRFL